uniref:Uncharacterized protein n=1 Tax=Sphaerodactylus townsendi TaxID=933632 RepID=A0ACB8GFJ3_9SAUR
MTVLCFQMYVTSGKVCGSEKKHPEDHARQSTTTDSELSELEDRVASALAEVQYTESEVSDIESRIAALSAAGLTVKPVEKSKKKSSTQVFTLQLSRDAQNSPEDHSSDSTPSPDNYKLKFSLTHLPGGEPLVQWMTHYMVHSASSEQRK